MCCLDFRVLCLEHHSNGNLADFINTRIHLLSDSVLQKISSDVANGLEFLHRHQLVHNSLSSKSVYISSLPEVKNCNLLLLSLKYFIDLQYYVMSTNYCDAISYYDSMHAAGLKVKPSNYKSTYNSGWVRQRDRQTDGCNTLLCNKSQGLFSMCRQTDKRQTIY